jgi:hypothetical protein
LWDSGNKNHSQFNLIKINTILHKYVCTLIWKTNIDTRYNYGGIAEYIADCTDELTD